MSKEQPLLSPSHPHSGCNPATPTHNQHNVTNTQQHFSNQQHSSMIYHTANTINTADMQNNQFCYDRTTVPLYSSGPGDTQDARPLPPGNPVNHQLGGKSYDHLMSCDHHFVIITPPPSVYIYICIYTPFFSVSKVSPHPLPRVTRSRLRWHETYSFNTVLFFLSLSFSLSLPLSLFLLSYVVKITHHSSYVYPSMYLSNM